MAVLLRKLLRIGKLPDEMRVDLEAEGILHVAEYVPVTRRFSGAIPGKRSSNSISSYAGSLVLTNERVLGTLSTMPKLAGRTIDQRWRDPQSGAVKAELSRGGLLLEAELADIDPRCEGHLSLQYRHDIPEDVLTRVPLRSLAFDVPAEWVFRAVGVAYHP